MRTVRTSVPAAVGDTKAALNEGNFTRTVVRLETAAAKSRNEVKNRQK